MTLIAFRVDLSMPAGRPVCRFLLALSHPVECWCVQHPAGTRAQKSVARRMVVEMLGATTRHFYISSAVESAIPGARRFGRRGAGSLPIPSPFGPGACVQAGGRRELPFPQ